MPYNPPSKLTKSWKNLKEHAHLIFEMRTTKNLTEGSIVKSLLILSWPIILANILQVAYQLVDTFWVGRISAEAVAAISFSFPILFLVISFGGGFALAGTILVSQYKGKGDLKQVDYVSAQTLLMLVVIATILSIIGFFFTESIVTLMGAEPEVIAGAVSYLQISFIGFIFMGIYFIFQSLLRGVGDVKTPLYVVLATVILNIILDPILIFGYGTIPAMGVTGAAIATITSQGVGALIGLSILFSGKYGIRMKIENFAPDFKLMKKIFWLGLPTSIEQSTRALGMTAMLFLISGFGTVAVASYGIAVRVFTFAFFPAMGIAIANTTMIGQNFGAGKFDRAEKIAKITAIISFSVLAVAGILCFIFAEGIAAFLVPSSLEVIETSTIFIKIFSLAFGFIGIQLAFISTFRGSGNTSLAMMMSLANQWLLELPLAIILSQVMGFGAQGIVWAIPITAIIMSIIVILLFKKGDWKKKRIIEHY